MSYKQPRARSWWSHPCSIYVLEAAGHTTCVRWQWSYIYIYYIYVDRTDSRDAFLNLFIYSRDTHYGTIARSLSAREKKRRLVRVFLGNHILFNFAFLLVISPIYYIYIENMILFFLREVRTWRWVFKYAQQSVFCLSVSTARVFGFRVLTPSTETNILCQKQQHFTRHSHILD